MRVAALKCSSWKEINVLSAEIAVKFANLGLPLSQALAAQQFIS